MEKIHLRPITTEELSSYLSTAQEKYAIEKEKSGLSPEDARMVAERSFKKLLPQGKDSANQFLFSVVEIASGQVIGTLWWGLQGEGEVKLPWIYDIELYESFRGKGYGRATILAAEAIVKKKGFSKLGLHVFGHNKVARSLYESMGFQITNLTMSKEI